MKRTILLVFLLLLAASLPAEVLAGHVPAGLPVNIHGKVSSHAPFLFSFTPNDVASATTNAPVIPGPFAPTITSSAATTFTVGSAGSFIVTTIGSPTPVLSVWGHLPTGVAFTDNGNGTATLAGTPVAATEADYAIYITASNGTLPNGIQAFTLHVIPAPPAPPLITSDNTTTFTVGAFGSFTITTTGSPTPTISRNGALPAGVTFVDNGNGTATLSGTPAVGSQGSYPFIIRATNGLSPDGIQAFALKVRSIPAIIVIPEMNFAYTIGGIIPPAQSLGITSSGTELSYTVAADQSWLSVSPSSGTTPGNISVTVIPSGLAVGVYQGKIMITAPSAENSPIPVGVTLTVSPGPQIIVGPTVLPFAYIIGGSLPAPRTIGITSSGSNFGYSVSTDQPWLAATPTSANTPSNITISVNPNGLAEGNHDGTVTITSAGASNSPQTAAVTLTVTRAPTLNTVPTALTYTFKTGDPAPTPQTVNVTSSDSPLNYTVSTNKPWLSATPASGVTPGSISVSVDPTGLAPGETYSGAVTVSSPDAANSPRIVTVDLKVDTGPNPVFAAGFDMRSTQSFVTDLAPNTYVLGPNTMYPTTRAGATFGWMDAVATAVDRSKWVDARLAGVNLVRNDISPGVFRVDLPAPGTYSISVALGDNFFSQCWTTCRIEFKDGSTSLFSLNLGVIPGGYFMDANGVLWSAEQWPDNNTTRDVKIAGSSLSVLVGANNNGIGTQTPVAFIGIKSAQNSDLPDFTLSASPASLTVAPGSSTTSTITTAVLHGFDHEVALSASGLPNGVTASFTPNPIAGPGAGTANLTFTASGIAVGTSNVTITATGGGVTRTATVNLTVGSSPPKSFAIGFDMRSTPNYVNDASTNTYVLGSKTPYPTTRNGVNFGWAGGTPSGEDRTNLGDSRLSGVNLLANDDSPGVFRVDLPGPGTYKISLAMGDRSLDQCATGCRIEFKDGNRSLFVLNQGSMTAGNFADANGNVWTAAEWPGSNTTRQVTLTGSTLNVFVGANTHDRNYTPIAFIGVSK